MDNNLSINSLHIVMENKEKGKCLYITIKAGYSPNVPEPLPGEQYSSLIKLARDAGTEPVFIGVVFEHVIKNGQSEVLCGDKFIVEYTGLIPVIG